MKGATKIKTHFFPLCLPFLIYLKHKQPKSCETTQTPSKLNPSFTETPENTHVPIGMHTYTIDTTLLAKSLFFYNLHTCEQLICPESKWV